MSKATKLVRMKTVHYRTGDSFRRYDYRLRTGAFLTFVHPGQWVRVDADVAERLALIRQDEQVEFSPMLFEVYNEKKAREVAEAERVKREAKKALREPTIDNAADMTSAGRGDLSLNDLPARQRALAEFSADVASDDDIDNEEDNTTPVPEEPPKPRAARKPKAAKKSRAKKSRAKKTSKK